MVQLNILSGKMAGATWLARRFPVHIGRSADSELQLEEDGVWDQHLVLDFIPAKGFSFKTQPNALARVNGQPASETLLRNGDTIDLGVVRLQFWISQVRQRSLFWREALSWAVIVTVCLSQIAALYWLVR